MASAEYDSLDLYTEGALTLRFQSLMRQSTQTHQGPPEKRLLNTVRENLDDTGNVRKWTFGEKNQSKTRTIMMMGETGTGKSTLINVMVNYILGVEWKHGILFDIIEEDRRCQTESQTNAVTVYEIYGQEDGRVLFSLRLIDTPGYGDTEGEDHDKLIAKNLMKLFQSEGGVHEIDAVCLVVKASQNRLTPSQRYIFDAILSLFGKDIESNIMALITFSDIGKPAALEAIKKAGVPCARDRKNQLVHYKFNNIFNESEYSTDDDDDDDDDADGKGKEKSQHKFQENWENGVKTMKKFFKNLDTMEMRSLQMTQEVLKERSQLEACVNNLRERIIAAEHVQNELRQTRAAVEEHKQDINANKEFTYEVDESFITKEDTENKIPATSCATCKTTCHYPCTVVPRNWLSWCAVMKGKKCTVCEKKCSYEVHIKECKMYKWSTRKVTKTFTELKEKYEKASEKKVSAELLEDFLMEELMTADVDKAKLIEESYQHIVSLSKIALKPESRSTLQHLDFLIDRLRETGNVEKAQRLCEIQRKDKVAPMGKLTFLWP